MPRARAETEDSLASSHNLFQLVILIKARAWTVGSAVNCCSLLYLSPCHPESLLVSAQGANNSHKFLLLPPTICERVVLGPPLSVLVWALLRNLKCDDACDLVIRQHRTTHFTRNIADS